MWKKAHATMTEYMIYGYTVDVCSRPEPELGHDNTRQYNGITWTDMESTSQQLRHDIVLVGKASPSTTTLFFYKDNFIRTMSLRFAKKLRTI